MASERPRHIMRNASLFINRDNYIGQASEIGFPEVEVKTEEIFNGGMVMPIECQMGYEMPKISFKLSGMDPVVMKLFGLRIGVETELMATAANVDDDGTVHQMTAYMRGFIKKMAPDSHKRGDKTELDEEFSVRYCKLEIDGQPVYEIDPFGFSSGGESQTSEIRRALLS